MTATRPMTKSQQILLQGLARAYGIRKYRGIIPWRAIECYDQRVYRGLIDRGLIRLLVDGDGACRHKLADHLLRYRP